MGTQRAFFTDIDSRDYFMNTVRMKNITVSVDNEVYHRARIFAAEHKTSVSALVRDHLYEIAVKKSRFERLADEEKELRKKIRSEVRGFSAADNVSREELYDRDALR
jgi:uncharacterized protein YdcH (DUF465 family)